jgi:hypothetical protein
MVNQEQQESDERKQAALETRKQNRQNKAGPIRRSAIVPFADSDHKKIT